MKILLEIIKETLFLRFKHALIKVSTNPMELSISTDDDDIVITLRV